MRTMFYIETVNIEQAESLLSLCGLTLPQAVDYTAGIFFHDRLVACGSLKGDMIKGNADHHEFQGED